MSDEYIEKEILKYIGQIQGVGYTKGLRLKDYKKKNQKGLHMMFKFLDEFEKNYKFKPIKPVQSSVEDIIDFYKRLSEED